MFKIWLPNSMKIAMTRNAMQFCTWETSYEDCMTRNVISHGVRGSLTLFHDLFVLCVLYKSTSRLVSIAIEPLFNELLCQDIPPARQI